MTTENFYAHLEDTAASLGARVPEAKSTRQQRYDQLVAQGVSSADALATEAAEYRTLNDRGIYRHPGF